MCRFLIFKGKQPIRLSHLLTRPAHSIINQSFDSRLRLDRRRPMNGDGFGVAYYPLDTELSEDGPCLFKAITPAWNNQNLSTLAEKTKSDLVFAHVRASTYGVLSETNCHPFTYHSLCFMHNGGISNFKGIKRKLLNHIKDEYLNFIQGSTDSECAFALFLDTLDKLGYDPKKQDGDFGNVALRKAMLRTIDYIRDWTKEANKNEAHVEPSLLNFAVTDGSTVVVSRYITSKTDEAASLHFSCGSSFVETSPGEYRVERLDRNQDVIMVASEPLTFERGDWTAVPTNSILTIKKQTILLHPIIDEYYQEDPLYLRSSTLAESKGLMGSIPLAKAVEKNVPPLEREGRTRPPTAVAHIA
ncbi:BFH_collapsed_G0045570.mRNA.1.CDS.1 [Saccharomyces cerevisiae]|nr:Dug3p [Saccharomyces cerevisiae YJM450]AJT06439.1 Dug3p [Saccharomyces cerevisiae YJM456]AJT07920.1 Dug3p [Saccharomyces cerevisiae YJM555]AJT13981.1 Dug3p [Saccharomyces cerevisiae YJM1083]AJT16214.1 Dug3p [Saccharomyces cerevisiae YJM1208]AJT18464.1 Dug3p [Saccharomyces cerevisiae YJM1273]AJT18831.1 Dug3p [Saccharomyces cerevisiae YJM1304]AJT25852.1 Dug3p [Saccharomyces cerevisiae YJM1400]AJT26216.1 Dug3p [Saccharomyces cerevisiae YJM1401]AJT29197.1 Dug3p [Saccharomyces cerevisiae YJM